MIGAVFAFYGVVAIFILVPLNCNRWLRRATAIVLGRCWELINPRCHCIYNDGVTPPRIIPFVDVFFADAMCSLSKVFFDWGMLLHSTCLAQYLTLAVRRPFAPLSQLHLVI